MSNSFEFFATAPKNLENLLSDELIALGAQSIKPSVAGISFTGDLDVAYKACMWSRVANRVLLRLAEFTIDSEDSLYQQIKAIDWSEHFEVTKCFAIDMSLSSSVLTHSQYAAFKVKDAVVDQFRERCDERPNVDVDFPDVRINVYINRNVCTVSIDLSGNSLHQRGYRQDGAQAPLKENLAAAILLRAQWPRIAKDGGMFLDPMCGSGTLAIEAALIAGDIAPGSLRSYFGFLGWKGHRPELWQQLQDEATVRREQGLKQLPAIMGFDQDEHAIRSAQKNVHRAGLADHVEFAVRTLADTTSFEHYANKGLVAVNPPYGKRIGQNEDLFALYAKLGEALRNNFPGWNAAVFTSDPALGKQMGIKAKRIHNMYNGALECKLLHFDITPENFVIERRLPRIIAAEELSENAQGIINRLKKNAKQLKRWLEQEKISCYRLYDADIPEYAVAIDVYQGEQRWVVIQEYEAPKTVDQDKARLRLREALSATIAYFGIPESQVFLKVRRQQKGSSQYEKNADKKELHQVMDGNCKVLVNFEDYLDTGLFLDHRITRQMLEDMAKGKRFLNLFAYTGVATVHAAMGGACSTTTVDMSNTYLDWAQQNMRLNGFSGSEHQYVQEDVLEWLKSPYNRKFDLIFLDPPSFSTSKRMQSTLDIQRDHEFLINACMRKLDPGGCLIFSNNLRRFKMSDAVLESYRVSDISKATIPRDFERNPRIHNCWRIENKDDAME